MTIKRWPTTASDIYYLMQRHKRGDNVIRQSDIDETVMITGKRVEDALYQGLNKGLHMETFADDTYTPLALWGTFEDEGELFGWFIATEEAQRRGKEMHRQFKDVLADYKRTVWALTARMDLDKWHRKLGFKLVTTATHGVIPVKIYRRDPPQWA